MSPIMVAAMLNEQQTGSPASLRRDVRLRAVATSPRPGFLTWLILVAVIVAFAGEAAVASSPEQGLSSGLQKPTVPEASSPHAWTAPLKTVRRSNLRALSLASKPMNSDWAGSACAPLRDSSRLAMTRRRQIVPRQRNEIVAPVIQQTVARQPQEDPAGRLPADSFPAASGSPETLDVFPTSPSSAPAAGSDRGDNSGYTVDLGFPERDLSGVPEDLDFRMRDGLIRLIARDARLSDILSILAADHGLNVVSANAIEERITVTLFDVPLADALDAILSVHGMTWTERQGILTVSRVDPESSEHPQAQGRVVRVFPLSFINADDATTVVQGLLSRVGSVQALTSQKEDTRKSDDRLVVEDLPMYLERVSSCLEQLDRPPRQVQIEAHILEIDLSTDNRHGVNLEALSEIAGSDIAVRTSGFGNASTSPSLLVGLDSGDLDGLLDAIKNTTDARTLASPRVMVTHGHEARIQIGGQIAFQQATTTQTATIQSVDFIDTGVVLNVTPHISPDGQILMKINPEVSDGRISPQTNLPEEELATVDSTVLLQDGQGMVIGGLIRERDQDLRAKAPLLGEAWMIGKLFSRVQQVRSRTEVIVAIVPRIVPCPYPLDERAQSDLDRVSVPLFHGPLQRQHRPWESRLPDVLIRPQTLPENYRTLQQSEGYRLVPEHRTTAPQLIRPGSSDESWGLIRP